MNPFELPVQMFFDWLLRTTCQVSVLICLVLLVQWALRRRLGVHGRYLLWGIIILRMIMPWAPQSRLSVFNLLPAWNQGERGVSQVEQGRARSVSN